MERRNEDNNTNNRPNTKRSDDSINSINKIVENTKRDLYNNLGTPKMDNVIRDTKDSLKK
jgi:hypothetical protein